MKASVFLGPLAVILHVTTTLAADKRLITPQDLWAMKRVSSPDENHWILTPQNSVHWNWEFQTWLARWIGGTPTLKKPLFNADAK